MSIFNIIIVGGHGNVSLILTRLLTQANHKVTSLIRNKDQENDIESVGASPHVISLEDASVSEFTSLFDSKNPDIIYFSAGAGGKPGPNGEDKAERTKKVDYEGAVKVFDAIEAMKKAEKPRLILVSACDVRNVDKVPNYYNEQDIALSKRMHEVIGTYYLYKTQADINLMKRTQFSWTILRPGGLLNDPATGHGDIGRPHFSKSISRTDVAHVLFMLASRPQAAGLAIDLVGGETPLETGLDEAINEKKTWRLKELE